MAEGRTDGEARGRTAGRPSHIPWAGWKDIAFRVKDEVSEDNLSIIAAGVAFHAMLALFPALAAVVSIYGLMVSPGEVEQQIAGLTGMLPAQAQEILRTQLHSVASAGGGTLGWTLVFSVLVALWASMRGIDSLVVALNVVYDEEERRGYFRRTLAVFTLTLGAVLFVVFALTLLAVLPPLLGNLGLGSLARGLVSLVRWPILFALAVLGLDLLYRYGPSRDQPKFRWVSWGAVAAAVLWVAGSVLFSWYVSSFGNYNETYGSLGAVVVLLLWLLLSAYVVLLGAELNAEMEHQTRADTTAGQSEPLGRRGAHVADTVGKSRK